MVALFLLSLLLAPVALASPWRRDGAFKGGCTVPQSTFSLPSNFDNLEHPPNLVLLGVGIQNYTCGSDGTYTSDGAVGQMFDVSCLYGTDDFYTIQDDAYIVWELYPDFDPLESEFAQAMKDVFDLNVIGQHYFVKQNGTLEAVWDCTSSPTFQHNPDAIVFAHPIKTAPSPNLNTIDWVELVGDSGGLAKRVYRIDTVEGEPPFICIPGDTASSKYSTKYLLV